MKKAELLHWLQEEYQQWDTLLDQIGPERMDQPGVNGDWSMKDTIAHLTGWHRWLVARLQATQRSEPEPSPPWPAHLQTEDEINARIYESNQGRSVREVLEETHSVFRQLLAVIEEFPDEVQIDEVQYNRAFYFVCVDEKRFPVGEFFDHFRDDHEPDVRAWLARIENSRAAQS
ncbi:MAG: ClbS/DfsB family four-helix bundle protein [Caldilineaceae bacterium]